MGLNYWQDVIGDDNALLVGENSQTEDNNQNRGSLPMNDICYGKSTTTFGHGTNVDDVNDDDKTEKYSLTAFI